VAGDGLIAAYLRELRASVSHLRDADDLVAEAEDHLRETAERLRDGRTEAEAEAEAIARFGSATYVARVCASEAKRGAAVPTRRTCWAGLSLFLAPVLLVGGTIGNWSTGKTWVHGLLVFISVLSVPAVLFGMWGLRRRHGGLGRVGLVAFVLALAGVPVFFVAGYYGVIVAFVFLAVALLVFAVEMVRAQVLPVVPIVMLALGPLAGVAVLVGLAVVPGKAWVAAAVALVPTVVACMWLGWCMWREPAVDRRVVGPVSAA
jgi:hypothetical protein